MRLLVEQVLTGRGSGAAEHHHRAGSGMRVDLPGGLDVRAVLGEVAGGLRRNAGTRSGNGEFTAGRIPDDDEQRGRLAAEHEWVIPVAHGQAVAHGQ